MSHAVGAVRTQDGRILFFEYDGTSDIVLPWLYAAEAEMHANWRRSDPFPECRCGRPSESAHLATTYGYGRHWHGHVCVNCMVVVGSLFRNWDDEHEGLPDWWPDADEKAESAELIASHR